ncbi:hypothetical protein RFI_39039 [Reticulomyxa filosa]|uniref:U-box domain-containing protein n=1 Tax=Reticulomyxa filosa TaxID=46433 RepID=X6LCL2_RETFI|nr:hypothetical protein RFI_39039 [Reticulomyxa filosa]|eukprot:ETN98459.1 hypothetical protein RFI_39039 [Reticulomyxa filosa]
MASFIGFTLNSKHSEIINFEKIIKNAQIQPKALSDLSKKDWMEIFQIHIFSQACLIHDTFAKLSNSILPEPVSSNPNVNDYVHIPKEYLCPLSKTIMTDPVIALDVCFKKLNISSNVIDFFFYTIGPEFELLFTLLS